MKYAPMSLGVAQSPPPGSPSAHASATRQAGLSWPLVWLLLALLSLAAIGPAYIIHDDAWYLYMARVLLDGGTLYRDVIDTNPPLIVFLTVPPVLFAQIFGVSAVVAFKAYVYLAALASLVASAALWRKAMPEGTRASGPVVIAALVFALFPFAKVAEFGQREHFMLMLTLPYIVAAIGWASGSRISRHAGVMVGLAAGLGFAMKPHYLLAWLAIEAALLAMRRRGSWRRPEALSALAATVCYGLAILAFTPQYLALAQKVRLVYGGLNSPVGFLFRLSDAPIWLAGLVLLLLVRLPDRWRPAAFVLFAAWTGFLVAAVLQLKGWSYHLYPGRAISLLFLVTLALAIADALPEIGRVLRGGSRAIGTGVAVVLLLSSARYVLEARRPVDADLVTPFIRTVRSEAPAGPVAVLSMRTIISPAFPAMNYTDARWGMRHNSLWFLAGLYEKELQAPDAEKRFRPPDAMAPLERGFYEEVVSDLCADPPALLLIETPITRAPAGRRTLDLAAYYAQDARYRNLSLAYRGSGTLGPFTVYKRTAAASCVIP